MGGGGLFSETGPHRATAAPQTSRLRESVSDGERSLRKSKSRPTLFFSPPLLLSTEWVSRRNVTLLCNSVNRNSCHLDFFESFFFFFLLSEPLYPTSANAAARSILKEKKKKVCEQIFHRWVLPRHFSTRSKHPKLWRSTRSYKNIHRAERPRAEENLCRTGTTHEWWAN